MARRRLVHAASVCTGALTWRVSLCDLREVTRGERARRRLPARGRLFGFCDPATLTVYVCVAQTNVGVFSTLAHELAHALTHDNAHPAVGEARDERLASYAERVTLRLVAAGLLRPGVGDRQLCAARRTLLGPEAAALWARRGLIEPIEHRAPAWLVVREPK